MEANQDKQLEKFVDDIMKDAVLEKPSNDFTTKIMSKVLSTKTNNIFVYKPLISKYVFAFIFGCFMALFIFIVFNGETQTDSWTNYFSFYNELTPHFNFSSATVYSVVFATIMLLVQISFLKNHYDKKFES